MCGVGRVDGGQEKLQGPGKRVLVIVRLEHIRLEGRTDGIGWCPEKGMGRLSIPHFFMVNF